MKRLSDKRIKDLVAEMSAASLNPSNWETWCDEHDSQPAWIEFPGGELMNPNITGWLWAWKLQGAIESRSLEKRDQFNANGLEGKISVKTSLTTALLVWKDLPAYRRQIMV